MDKAPIIGIGGAFGVLMLATILEGGSPVALIKIPAILLVLGGTFGAAMAGGTMADFKAAMAAGVRAFTWKPQPAGELVPVIVELAGKARREGLLTLEGAVKDVEDEFLKRGVKLAVDGVDPEELRDIMECELVAKKAGDKHVAKFYADMGGYAPTIGIIGTVMGLVHVLENLSQPDKLGELISAAFIATLWGVMTANVVFLPIGNRLTRMSQIESGRMELVIEGVLAVQAGANPRAVAQRLSSLLPAHEREDEAA